MSAGILPDDYFGQARRDVLALVPREARCVLDVGCGFGALGRLLATERGCTVHGIERNPHAAAHLEGIYARYVIGDIEASIGELSGERYDCIVLADILEHLVDPWTAVDHCCGLLAPEGVVVASIPNVRNLALIFNLVVRGRWRYEESGLLDRTHLRFFTRAEVHALFDRVGLEIERIVVNRDRFRPLVRPAAAIAGFIVRDLDVCQFVVRARQAKEPR